MSREDPLVVAKLKQSLTNAEDLAQTLIPETLDQCSAPVPDYDDCLTTEEKVLAISRLESAGRTRSSGGEETRVISNENNKELFKLRYGWVCQAGFYPEDLSKKNQDNLLICTELDSDLSLFTVCDGHGKAGTECSTFAVERIRKYMCQHKHLRENPEKAFEEALHRANKDMHKQKRKSKHAFDDTLAGTTAVSVLFHGNEVVCANVGDSRAIVCSEVEGRIIAEALSVDQTPYRLDERERCRSQGAIVLTMDQLEGYKPYDPDNPDNWGEDGDDDGGDPPRLWLPGQGCPGVAFTRSLGDEMAESIGCIATPEVLRRQVLKNDRFIVIASDGVFEFLSSQTVCDIVSKFTCPYEAARALVAESYKLWLHFEVRTDDITAIVIFLEHGDSEETCASPMKRLRRDEQQSERYLSLQGQSKPVRREMSRKKREMIEASAIMDEEDEESNDESGSAVPPKPKSEEELRQIKAAIASNFLFAHLEGKPLNDVLVGFTSKEVKAGDVVITQGEVGREFYIVNSGEYECYIKQEGEPDKLVMSYCPRKSGIGNPSFGELALLHNKPRAAQVIAKTDGRLWALSRGRFRKALIKEPNKAVLQTLSNVKFFEAIGKSQLRRLCDYVNLTKFKDGDSIVVQGEEGNEMFVIKTGGAQCVIGGKVVLTLGPGGYFGEKSLIKSEPRAATVCAVGPTECYTISRTRFEEVLGPLSSIIERDAKMRELESFGVIQANERATKLKISEGLEGLVAKCNVADGLRLVHVRDHDDSVFILKSVNIKETEEGKLEEKVLRDKTLLNLAQAIDECDTGQPTGLFPMVKTFQGETGLHIAFQGVSCGPLVDFMSEPFSENIAKFVASSIVSILSHLHSRHILCRSINPQTLLLDDKGFVKLNDLGNGRYLEDASVRSYTMCGDTGYIAPEQVVLTEGHHLPVDYWALGVLIYEMLSGELPFDGLDGDIFSRISQYDVSTAKFPDCISAEARDLIMKLLKRSPSERMCDPEEISKHPWFVGFDRSMETSPLEDAAQHALKEALSSPSGVTSVDKNLADNLKDQECWYSGF